MKPAELLTSTPLSLSEISRRSGVSRNTLNLWRRGSAQPSLEALDKVARVLGYDVSVSVQRMSDAAAATAARVLLGELDDESPTVQAWIERFVLWGDVPGEEDDSTPLIERAAWASHPYGRQGAFHFLPMNPITIASAIEASGQPWAISGAYAVEHGPRQHSGTSGLLGSTLIWCTDPAVVLPSLPRRVHLCSEPVAGGVSLAPASGTELAGEHNTAGIHYVSELQVDIDVRAERYAGGLQK